jgi:head-tail adaptor
MATVYDSIVLTKATDVSSLNIPGAIEWEAIPSGTLAEAVSSEDSLYAVFSDLEEAAESGLLMVKGLTTADDIPASIPAGATLLGFELMLNRQAIGADVDDVALRLVQRSNLCPSIATPARWANTLTEDVFGGEDDLWDYNGEEWAAEDIDEDFGFSIRASADGISTAKISNFSMEVFYSYDDSEPEPEPEPVASSFLDSFPEAVKTGFALYRKTYVTNSHNESVETWPATPESTFSGALRTLSGDKRFVSALHGYDADCRLYVAPSVDIQVGDRVLYDSKTFEVKTVNDVMQMGEVQQVDMLWVDNNGELPISS